MRKASARQKSTSRKRGWITFFVILGSCASFGFLGATLYAFHELNNAAEVVHNLPEKMDEIISTPTTIVSSDGVELYTISAEFRKPVSIKDIPDVVKKTTLAAEDLRFYEHTGVDLIAAGRVLFDAAAGGRRRGASTITMQLAKQLFTGSDVTLQRKLDQMAIAVQMEKLLNKDQILEHYLNHSYYGEGAYGIWAAAHTYFDKDLDELTLAEAALLARIVRRPSDENPVEDMEASVRNRNVVLKIMVDEGIINSEEYNKALAEPVVLKHNPVRRARTEKVSPYFVDYVLKEVKKVMPGVDVLQGGYRIETTLNQKLQQEADREVREVVDGYRSISEGAAVVMDTEGRIRAMVGGQNHEKNQFNSAADGRRQPGSSFKPFVYLLAAQNSLVTSPWSSVDNGAATYRKDGRVVSVRGGGPMGSVSMISALTYSYNRAAWNTIERVGAANVVRYAKNELGFTGYLPAVPSLSLGTGLVSPLEMAQAYTIFPLKGRRATAYGVERVLGPNGLPVYTSEADYKKTSFSPRSVEIIDRCLRDVVAGRGGTGAAAGRVPNARGKTGTTNDNKDAWFAGYTDEYVAVVWFSNPDRSRKTPRYRPMGAAIMGGKVGAPTWADILVDTNRILGSQKRRLVWEHLDGRGRNDIDMEEPRRRTEEDPNGDGVIGPGEMPRPTREAPPNRTRDDEGAAPEGDPASVDGATGGQETPPPAAPPTATPATEPPRARREEPVDEIVVSICADSGQRASVYCPERVNRRFKRGTEPKGRCPIHGP